MPEGDTVHRIARVLGRELTGRTIDRLELHDRGDIAELGGKRIESIEAIGKHMLVTFDAPWVMRVHLGMNGHWRRLHIREKAPRHPTVRIEVGDAAYVCERAYRAELIRQEALRSNPRLARLGPDLLADPPDIDAAVGRAAQPGNAGREIGDLIMDQRVASGVGNVYKSEVLFECRVHPRALMHQLSPDSIRRIYEKANELMRLNLLTRRRTSVPLKRRPEPSSHRFWVYMRAGKPCLDCGTNIERFLQGDVGRSTYFCPQCQAVNDISR
ncbi:MAG: DNA-formamidopyrimidine glycosylase family protein [Longimicrobiales bacterium]